MFSNNLLPQRKKPGCAKERNCTRNKAFSPVSETGKDLWLLPDLPKSDIS